MASILIVDDEPHMVRVMKLRLEGAGHEVEAASNGQEAFNILRAREFDVLVTDINMPSMTGRELCEAVRRELFHQPAIFVVTGRPGKQHREWPKDLSNVDFVEKPVSLRKLIAQIEEGLEKRNAEDA